MWHKPCRTFHPWCPCIKTRCLSTHWGRHVREILIKFIIINLRWKYEVMLWIPTNVSSHWKKSSFELCTIYFGCINRNHDMIFWYAMKDILLVMWISPKIMVTALVIVMVRGFPSHKANLMTFCTKWWFPTAAMCVKTVSSNETFGYIGCQGKMSSQCHRC